MKKLINRYFFTSFYSARRIVLFLTFLIISVSLLLFFYFQQDTENSIRKSIFEQQQENQVDNAKALARNIKSDLDSIKSKLQGIALSKNLQLGDFNSNSTKDLLEKYYKELKTITPVDRIFISDKNGISRQNIVPVGEDPFLGKNFSHRDWVKETKDSLSPVFSKGFIGADGKYRIAITYPIMVNNSKGLEYLGLAGVVIPTIEFFKHYGNVFDIKSQYLIVLDKAGVHLIHPVEILLGKPFFGSFVQNFTGNNPTLNNHVKSVVTLGKESIATYKFRNEERLNTGFSIIIDGKPLYSIFLVTPTATIYSTINEIISKERNQMLSLIIGIVTSITFLIIFLTKLNVILDREVDKRTKELGKINQKLETANKQLQINDKIQKEFIHTAAHELRTPVQSITGFSELLTNQRGSIETFKFYIEIINKNAIRLQKLITRVLDITQIDSDSLILKKETFDLIQFTSEIIHDYQYKVKSEKKIDFDFQVYLDNTKNSSSPMYMTADRIRLHQVFTNLIDNALEFSKEGGKIIVKIEKSTTKNEVIVKIIDSGHGISQEIFPILFNKFVTRSKSGTGLGLYLSKKVIETHGGRIWAFNNINGLGATFSFSIPL